jgi:N-acetylmuramoyl-L-alanine amidase
MRESNIKPCWCQEKLAKILVMSAHFYNVEQASHATRRHLPVRAGHQNCRMATQQRQGSYRHAAGCPGRHWMMIVCFVCVNLLCVSLVDAQEISPQRPPTGVIVLDPGHGGKDSGAIGHDNMTEKALVMAFARAMTKRLKTSYQVMLTRRDDYQITLFERSALANHHRADLFVSIHTGATIPSNPRGMALFYYESPVRNPFGSGFQPDSYAESSLAIKPWELQRPQVVTKSRYLVELIKKRLLQSNKDLKLTSRGAPLIVLAGVEMPAVLIEIGHVTNPMDAKALKDDARLTELAGQVCDAIDDFFQTI